MTLSGCYTVYYTFDDILEDDVVSIQFYDLTDTLTDDTDELFTLDPFYTLDESEHAAFMTELKQLEFSDTKSFMIASDPLYSYGDYVVRFNFEDGSFKLRSCAARNETFDADGNKTNTTYFSCDPASWNDLVYAFSGRPAARLWYKNSEFVMEQEHETRLREIFAAAPKADDALECDFVSYDCIKLADLRKP